MNQRWFYIRAAELIVGCILLFAALTKALAMTDFVESLITIVKIQKLATAIGFGVFGMELALGAAVILRSFPLKVNRAISVLAGAFIGFNLFAALYHKTWTLTGELSCQCLGEFTPVSLGGKLALNAIIMLTSITCARFHAGADRASKL